MKKYFIHLLSSIALIFALVSCASSNVVVSKGIDISKYKYVQYGTEQTGDGELGDIVMMVQNEISDTRLKVISSYEIPEDAYGHTLSPNIHVTTEKWNGGHTYITVTFYDLYTHQSVAVIKSSGIGLTVPDDQRIALNAIKKKLQETFK